MTCQSIGVIGAGQMGNGIAQVFAFAGYDVQLNDLSEDALTAAIARISKNLDRQISRGHISRDEKSECLTRIQTTTDLVALGGSDLVIEAATEHEEIKARIFSDLQPSLQPHTILASNTSSISITRLAAGTDRPEQFIGLHFMNPVPVMKLVELIRGISTSEDTYQEMLKLVDSIGKTAASAEDYPAFIVNRVLIPMINEAVYALYEGVGSVSSIDASMKLGANHPMGPLELGDFIGLDTCVT